MSVSQDKNSMNRFAGGVLFVSGCFPSDTAELASSGGVVKELAFSFYDCTPALPGPQISVLSDLSDQSDQSDYALVVEAARDFCGWITVTAYAVVRNAVWAFRRVVCELKALLNRRAFIFQGGLRL